ncbi:MAG TPA: ACP S-malonyltransferase [Steroidobacteraceae bacterium]|jgi:[acyl-carrier-protein] S-malonyltransferase|nr:ACP S-malonyltransferase [Steroidobacteraceae bacterium]
MSNNLAFVFPGQGSQALGMLGKLADVSPVVRVTFDEASSVLGYDLWQLCSQGPIEELNATERTQPAMLVAGIATWRLWQERAGPMPAVVTGHSLGEFTALVAAGAIDFTNCVDLVRFRGKAMQEAVPLGTGSMAALLGLEDAEVEAACAEAAQGSVVEAVNFNSPGQVVIAGEKAAVLRAIEAAKVRGAKRAIELPVSVPSHSSLMKSAGARLGERLASTEIRAPRIRYLSAVDAQEHTAADDIRALLVRQLSSPVRWTATVTALSSGGAKYIVECGPGGVLAGLVKRIEKGRDTRGFSLDEPESFQAALGAVAA